jgi:hypothetical protein
LGNDGKSTPVEELRGGDARTRRGGEESEDGCGEDRARASTFYRGWREVEVASMAGHEGASYTQ